jgi:hypothetical protein
VVDTVVDGRSAVQLPHPGGPWACFARPAGGYSSPMDFLLWILAVILVVSGIVALFRRQILWGIVLIIVGFLVGPGGVSVFH